MDPLPSDDGDAPPRPLFHPAPSPNPIVLLFVDSGLDEDRMFESKLMVKELHNKGCMSRGLAVVRAL